MQETNIEFFVARELDTIFNGLSLTIISLQKKKLGIVGEIPSEFHDDFIEGVILTCRSMVGVGMVRELEERLRNYDAE